MAFIRVTNRFNGAAVHISAEHIISVTQDDEGSYVTMAVAGSDGAHRYIVQEPVEDILNSANIALAYRRR